MPKKLPYCRAYGEISCTVEEVAHLSPTAGTTRDVPPLRRVRISELGASLFEIAQSLFALEQTMILGTMVLNEKKSDK